MLAHSVSDGALDDITGIFGLSPDSTFLKSGIDGYEHKVTFDLNKDAEHSVYIGEPNLLDQVGHHAPIDSYLERVWTIEVSDIRRKQLRYEDSSIITPGSAPFNAVFDLSKSSITLPSSASVLSWYWTSGPMSRSKYTNKTCDYYYPELPTIEFDFSSGESIKLEPWDYTYNKLDEDSDGNSY